MNVGETRPGTLVSGKEAHELAEGEYMWCEDDPRGRRLYIHPPGGPIGALSPAIHTILEHEDGTVTVYPSILCIPWRDGSHGWHGYLESGGWRRVP